MVQKQKLCSPQSDLLRVCTLPAAAHEQFFRLFCATAWFWGGVSGKMSTSVNNWRSGIDRKIKPPVSSALQQSSLFVHVLLCLRADLVLSLLFANPDFCVLDTPLRCLLHNAVYTCLPPKAFVFSDVTSRPKHTPTNYLPGLSGYEMKLQRASLFPTSSASCGCDSIATNEKTNEN